MKSLPSGFTVNMPAALAYMPRTRLRIGVLCLFTVAVVSIFLQPASLRRLAFGSPQGHNAVIYMLTPPDGARDTLKALRNIEDRFNRRLKYPLVLFTTEDEKSAVSESFKAKVNWITEGRATFGILWHLLHILVTSDAWKSNDP
jgi:Glycolipid 2-alpha-mannosyltransferase